MSQVRHEWMLPELLKELGKQIVPQLRVTGITQDSRRVQSGDLFIARSGTQARGADYIEQAIEHGAVAVLLEQVKNSRLVADSPVPVIEWNPSDLSLGALASRFYGDPSKQMCLIGITGTNGKTSSAHFVAQALNTQGGCAALIGTLGNGFLDQLEQSTHTTPDPIELNRLLAEFLSKGATQVVMEVSSHAIDQGRIDGLSFDLVGYTNLTRDHLDYHKTMEAYAAAKARLFTEYAVPLQVLNQDDSHCRALLERTDSGVTRAGFSREQTAAPVSAQTIEQNVQGSSFELKVGDETAQISTPLMGRFNIENLLLTATALHLLGFNLGQIESAINNIKPVTGRMERFSKSTGPSVVVDYAHTPDALCKALEACKEHVRSGELSLVFGCGGDRDRGKRPLMAKEAQRYADRIWVTSDNPRTEDPQQIIEDILAGFSASSAVQVEADRAKAIDAALSESTGSDLVLIAGKGHEDYQEIGTVRYPFLDRAVAEKCLEGLRS